jgi:plastocyanin
MRRLLVLLPIAVLLAACGGSEEESEQAGPVLQTIQISETEFSLDPSTVNLSKPGTYEFRAVNDGQVTHALEIEGKGIETETEDIEPGETMTLRVTLSESGSYELYCPIDGHKGKGMEGTVTVRGGAASGGTTTDEDEATTGQTTTTGY